MSRSRIKPESQDSDPDRPSSSGRVPLVKRPGRIAALLAAGAGVSAVVYLAVLVFTTPDVDALRRAQGMRASVILSADGEVIGRFASTYQAPVALKDVAPDLINALIATEDHRFYEHHGIDPKRLLASVWNTMKGDTQGGSTLTQQLARNLFPQEIGNERSLNRKLREAITALRLERSSTKDQILESYLNSAPFLYNVRGVEMAARTYFDKPAARLDTVEAATLVGMLKGTHRYNPVRNPERARDRRNLVLAQMVKQGTLQQARYQRLIKQPLALQFQRPEDGDIGQARHFVAHVREQLIDWADAHDLDLDGDGLVIQTTLDARLQKLAQNAVVEQVALLQRMAGEEWSDARLRTARVRAPAPDAKRKSADASAPFAHFWRTHEALLTEAARTSKTYRDALASGSSEDLALQAVLADDALMERLRDDKTRLTAGFVAIDPTSGAVKAWVGSPDFGREQFDHVSQARRQPGSTFKPFVYGAALQRGISTEHRYADTDVEIPLGNGRVWRPTDGGGPSGESMTLREGLVQSKNTITAQVMQEVGAEAVVNFAQSAGVRESVLDPVPSLALGTSPVTLLEMADAYATLAALGERHAPLMITKITDRDGRVLETFDSAAQRVLGRPVVEKLVDVMRGVVQSGTGAGVRNEWRVRGDLAGKTGTTQDNTDGWFMLMSPTLVTGAWVGFNDPRVTIRSDYWGQGGHNALRLVGAFMQQAQKAKLIDPNARFPQVVRDAPEATEPPPSADEIPFASAIGAALSRWFGTAVRSPRAPRSAAEEAAATRAEERRRDPAIGY
ncbi:MAG: transglycosylase domain-containing protein [Burkholderiaceae bacterium]